MRMTLRSEAFADGKPIPTMYSGDGEDRSPPLAWEPAPAGTREFALICDDPDAPGGDWVHWVIYKIPASANALPEGFSSQAELKAPVGILQGQNSWETIGYRGPQPPKKHGPHHYYFRLYALDGPLELKAGATKQELLSAMQGHVIGQGQLVGVYER